MNEDKDNNTTDSLNYWYYDDVISYQDCDALISVFNQVDSEEGGVTHKSDSVSQEVNKSIRNTNRIVFPTYKGIGALLTAVGIDANAQRWKFNINGPNQCEILKYPVGGMYRGHIDTILSNKPTHLEQCRKLTVLAFLNDDFQGGKFFLNIGPNKFYPPQEKSSVLVFPSFIHHGVEDVTEGNRYSAVCWLVGPWFK